MKHYIYILRTFGRRFIINPHTKPMKKLAIVIALAAFAVPAFAESVTGEAQCAKCALKKVDECQMAIKVDGKDEIIMVENNDVSKAFHKKICKENVQVVAEGTVVEKDGAKVMTLTKVEEKK